MKNTLMSSINHPRRRRPFRSKPPLETSRGLEGQQLLVNQNRAKSLISMDNIKRHFLQQHQQQQQRLMHNQQHLKLRLTGRIIQKAHGQVLPN